MALIERRPIEPASDAGTAHDAEKANAERAAADHIAVRRELVMLGRSDPAWLPLDEPPTSALVVIAVTLPLGLRLICQADEEVAAATSGKGARSTSTVGLVTSRPRTFRQAGPDSGGLHPSQIPQGEMQQGPRRATRHRHLGRAEVAAPL
jgi:hypothetical protein